MRDTYTSMAHISNRLRFDTFFTFIFSFENGISKGWTSLPQKKKCHLFDKNSEMTMIYEIITKSAISK